MKFLFFCALTFTFLSHAFAEEEKGFKPLFDGKTLNGWQVAKPATPSNTKAPNRFSVNEKEKAIHVYAGQKNGSKQESDCLNTVKQYSHYILRLEYKWTEKRFAPRSDWDRDSGLLFHVHGDLKRVWPHCLEMQIGETPGDEFKKQRFHSGDLFVIGKHLRVQSKRTNNVWDPKGKTHTGKSGPTKLGKEKPKGEWNKIEIRVSGAKKATFILNGEIVYEVTNMEQKKDGKFVPLEKGHIGLQAEWAEILYRNIRIKELPETTKK